MINELIRKLIDLSSPVDGSDVQICKD